MIVSINKKNKPKRNNNLLPQNIISMSLYGTGNRYLRGAIWNMENYQKYYPGWKLRIYCDENVPIINELKAGGCEIILKKINSNQGPTRGMFWRFLSMSDPKAKYIIIRDIDSKLNEKESAAVREWINSGLNFHIMEDYYWPEWQKISGSAFGIKGGVIPDIQQLILEWMKKHPYSVYYSDEQFLSKNIWPIIENSCLIHSSFGRDKSKKFPIKASIITRHVGEREFY